MAQIRHNKKHGITSTSDHNGVSGATENNLVSIDANGLPADAGIAKASVQGAVKGEIILPFDEGGSVLTTGAKKIYARMPCAGTITGVTLYADQTGSVVVDIWKDTYANFPPTDTDSITASAPPTLSSAQKSEDTTLTGWTTTFSAGDVLEFNIDSCSTITKLSLALAYNKTGV